MTAGDRERPALLSKRIIRNPRSSTNHSSLLGLTMALLSRLSNSNGEQGGATVIPDRRHNRLRQPK